MGELQAGEDVFRSAPEAGSSGCRGEGRLQGRGWSRKSHGGLVKHSSPDSEAWDRDDATSPASVSSLKNGYVREEMCLGTGPQWDLARGSARRSPHPSLHPASPDPLGLRRG